MFETIKNAFKVKDIRKKIIYTLLLLLVFRLGCYIPVPGLEREYFKTAIEGNTFLNLMSSITGGSLANGTLFALGIGPYINATIIMQLLCVGIPALERLQKQGEDGKRKISNITRVITIILAIIQSVGIILNFALNNKEGNSLQTQFFFGTFNQTLGTTLAAIYMTIIYTAGACIVMWLGDRMTENGVGNGMSMIIFIGILSTGGQTIIDKFAEVFGLGDYVAKPVVIWEIVAFVVLSILIFAAIVTVDLSERRIPVNYAKQVKGRKMYGGQSSMIPMRISGSGVMPLIFAFAVISVPSMITSMFWPGSWFELNVLNPIMSGKFYWVYVIILCLLIFAFSFFYAKIQFNADDVSKSIQQNGGFIQGIRPGKPTTDYLNKISNRITLFGAIYLSLVAFIPSIAFGWISGWTGATSGSLTSVFSTTGILIVVSVALEFDKQLQAQMMMKNYKGFLK